MHNPAASEEVLNNPVASVEVLKHRSEDKNINRNREQMTSDFSREEIMAEEGGRKGNDVGEESGGRREGGKIGRRLSLSLSLSLYRQILTKQTIIVSLVVGVGRIVIVSLFVRHVLRMMVEQCRLVRYII